MTLNNKILNLGKCQEFWAPIPPLDLYNTRVKSEYNNSAVLVTITSTLLDNSYIFGDTLREIFF